MDSALKEQLLNLKGLPFIAGVIWVIFVAIALLGLTVISVRSLRHKAKTSKNPSLPQKNEPKGFQK